MNLKQKLRAVRVELEYTPTSMHAPTMMGPAGLVRSDECSYMSM